MIRRLVALGVAASFAALGLDRWLQARRRGASPEPIRTFVVVDAAPERVWAELADIEGQPRWMREMKEVRILTPGPVDAGTRGEALVRIFGIGVRDPVTVTTFEPPARFAIRHEGLFGGGGTIELTPGADGTSTVVRWEETLIPPVLPQLGALLQRPVLTRIFQRDLGLFRELLETPAPGVHRAIPRDGEQTAEAPLAQAGEPGRTAEPDPAPERAPAVEHASAPSSSDTGG